LYQVRVVSISALALETISGTLSATTPASGGTTNLTVLGTISLAADDAMSNPDLAEQWQWRAFEADVSGNPDRRDYIMWTAGGTAGTQLKSLMIFTLDQALQPGDTINSVSVEHYNSNIATSGNRTFTFRGITTLNPTGPSNAATMLALVDNPAIRTTAQYPVTVVVGGSPAAYFEDYDENIVNMATLGWKTWNMNPAVVQELVSGLSGGQTITRLPLMTDTVGGQQPNNTEVAAFESSVGAGAGTWAVRITLSVSRSV
jgi:hypothetical protein